MAQVWVSQVLTSVVMFVTGMLCLVRARRNLGGRPGGSSPRTDSIGVPANFIMAFVSTLLALLVLGLSRTHRRDLRRVVERRDDVLPWVVAFAALFFAGNMFYFEGLAGAPNAGYARALMTVEVGALAVLSAWLFGAPLSWRKIAGIASITVGAALVST